MMRPGTTGWIEVVCGSMFSGKTEELIRRFRPLRRIRKIPENSRNAGTIGLHSARLFSPLLPTPCLEGPSFSEKP